MFVSVKCLGTHNVMKKIIVHLKLESQAVTINVMSNDEEMTDIFYYHN